MKGIAGKGTKHRLTGVSIFYFPTSGNSLKQHGKCATNPKAGRHRTNELSVNLFRVVVVVMVVVVVVVFVVVVVAVAAAAAVVVVQINDQYITCFVLLLLLLFPDRETLHK